MRIKPYIKVEDNEILLLNAMINDDETVDISFKFLDELLKANGWQEEKHE